MRSYTSVMSIQTFGVKPLRSGNGNVGSVKYSAGTVQCSSPVSTLDPGDGVRIAASRTALPVFRWSKFVTSSGQCVIRICGRISWIRRISSIWRARSKMIGQSSHSSQRNSQPISSAQR